MLGRDLAAHLEAHHQVVPVDLPEVDITDLALLQRTFDSAKLDVVIHTAAFTAVDDCEHHSDLAFRVNAEGTRNVAVACRVASVRRHPARTRSLAALLLAGHRRVTSHAPPSRRRLACLPAQQGSPASCNRPRNLSHPLRLTTIAPYRLLFNLRLTGQSPWSRPRKPKLRWVILFQLGFSLQTERAPLRAQVLGEGRDPGRALTSYGSLYPTFRTAAQARNRLGRRLHRSHLAAMPRL